MLNNALTVAKVGCQIHTYNWDLLMLYVVLAFSLSRRPSHLMIYLLKHCGYTVLGDVCIFPLMILTVAQNVLMLLCMLKKGKTISTMNFSIQWTTDAFYFPLFQDRISLDIIFRYDTTTSTK